MQMRIASIRTAAAATATAFALAACASAAPGTGASTGASPTSIGTAAGAPAASGVPSPAAQARADSGRPPFTAADVQFMQGMIAHHAQALVMAGWAAERAAGSSVRTLAGRIDVGQRDEIAMMQRWLRDRRQPVPDADELARHAAMGHHPATGSALAAEHMPGMLTAEQLAGLEKARGAEFDRLFLTYMIQHHEGAVAMVRKLFASRGAGQDITVFRLASDVEADQTTEIERMRSMLEAMGP